MTKRIEEIRLKIERAEHHINDFRSAAQAFAQTSPHASAVETDQRTGDKFIVLTKVSPISKKVMLSVGDALQNLRSALDYLAHALVLNNSASPSTRTGFPICEHEPQSKNDLDKFTAQVNGMGKEAIHAIKAMRPYKGGDDILWRLHRLNNVDKHRLLMGAATCVSRFNPAFSTEALEYVLQGGRRPAVSVHMDAFPLKEGDKFPVQLSGSRKDKHPQFLLEIAFNEPEISVGEVVLTVLNESACRVRQVVQELVPWLRS